MAKLKYTDNAASLLTATVNNTDDPATLSITAGDGAKFPSLAAGEWFPLVVVKTNKQFEKMRGTARSGDSITATRAQGGTTKLSFAIGDAVYLGPTKEFMDELLFREDALNGKPWYCGVATGTANAIALTANPVPTAYTDGMELTFTALSANSSASVTVNVNGLGAVNLRDAVGNSLAVGSIAAGGNYRIQRNGTANQFRIVSGIVPSSVPGDFTVNGQLFVPGGIDILPKNTKMLFINNAAPAGWTFDATHADRVIRCAASAGAGGGTGGSWTISGISVNNHTLTTAQIPPHSHIIDTEASQPANFNPGAALSPIGSSALGTSFLASRVDGGSGGAHNHGLTIGNAWRPSYVDAIVCTMSRGP